MEWTVGPVPIDDGLGKEVISRFTTNIKSQAKLLTDSNGRDMLERQRCVPSPAEKPSSNIISQHSEWPCLNQLPVFTQVLRRRRHDLPPQRAWISGHGASGWKLFPSQHGRGDPRHQCCFVSSRRSRPGKQQASLSTICASHPISISASRSISFSDVAPEDA